MYQQGIQVLEKDLQVYKDANNHPQFNLTVKQKASAFASIAELYMQDPLCDEPDAEQECENCLATAIQTDPESLCALLSLANLRMLRNRDKEAAEFLRAIHKRTCDLIKR